MASASVPTPASGRALCVLKHLATSARLTAKGGAQEQPSISSQPAAASAVPRDVCVYSAVRTPIGKARRGAFKHTPPDDLLATVLKEAIVRGGIKADAVQDIGVGNVLLENGAAVARMGQLLADIPYTVPIYAINRQCSSGLQACMNVAASIRNGWIDFGLGAGVESMSKKGMGGPPEINPKVFENDAARKCLTPMGITSENVAAKYGVSRQDQDQMALESHQKAARARSAGVFGAEIVPTLAVQKDEDGNDMEPTLVTEDDGIRPKTNLTGLGKLRPAFQKGGSTTAGNSSQVSDGAAAVLLGARQAGDAQGLKPLASLCSYAVVGVPPDVMGIGPAFAIPEAVKQAGLSLDDIGLFEINEAFASQAVYCVRELGIPMEKVNVNGGAIALGHPLGCTGARQIATLVHEMRRRGTSFGVVSMCIGTGMGAAAVFKLEA